MKRVILLNGPSSSGKTSLAKALQDLLPEPYMRIGIDQVIDMMPEQMNDWTGKKVEHGFWCKESFDSDGNKISEVIAEGFAQKITPLLQKLVLTMLEAGHNVIIDDVCIHKSEMSNWREVLSEYDAFYVGIHIDLDIIVEREKSRGDRLIGLARAQHKIVHLGNKYDIEVDSGKNSIEHNAREILKRVMG